MKIRFFLAALFFAGATAGQALAQADYEIRLFRPSKAGDRYRVSATGHQIRQMVLSSGAGEALRSERDSFAVDMTGSVRVLDVDPKGNVVRAEVTVDSLVRAVGLERSELLKPGTVVIEERAGSRQVFKVDGRVVGADLKDALDVALSETNDPGAPSDDELMGTRERKKVGERWQVNRDRLSRFFSEDSEINLAVGPGDIEGGGTLAAVARVGSLECLRVDVAFTIAGKPRGGKELDPLAAKARIDVKLSGLYPVDPALDVLEESTQLTMVLTAPAGPPRDGKPADQLVSTWEQRSDRRLQPIR